MAASSVRVTCSRRAGGVMLFSDPLQQLCNQSPLSQNKYSKTSTFEKKNKDYYATSTFHLPLYATIELLLQRNSEY